MAWKIIWQFSPSSCLVHRGVEVTDLGVAVGVTLSNYSTF